MGTISAITILVNCAPKQESCKKCYLFTCDSSWTAQSLDRTGKNLPGTCVPMKKRGKAVTKYCREQEVGMGLLPRSNVNSERSI